MQDNGSDTSSSRPTLVYGAGILLGVLNTATALFGIAMLIWAVSGLQETGEQWGLVGVMLFGGAALAFGAVVLVPATLLFFFTTSRRISRSFRRWVLVLAVLAVLTNGSALACIFGDWAWGTWTSQRANPLHATGLEHAIRTGDVAATHEILTSDLDLIHERDFYGNTPLMLAVKEGDPAMVKMLLDCGADPNETGWAGLPLPLHLAVQKSNVEIARLLLDGGADVNLGDGEHRTPLAYAIKRNNAALITLLKERGGVTEDTRALMSEAMHYSRIEQVKDLIENRGFDPKYRYPNGSTLISKAARNNNRELVLYLLSKGADITARYPGGTALHDAAFEGHTDMCLLLIEHGVPLDVRNHLGETALEVARQGGHDETVRVLKEHDVPE